MNKPLLSLIDGKIEQLERYGQITSQMVYEDIDSFDELIEERQRIITAMDGISVEIKRYISEQSIERRQQLEALMEFKDIGELSEQLLELQAKIGEMNDLKRKINEDDKLANDRLKNLRDDLVSLMEDSAKNKKFIDYFSQTNINVNKGKTLNISN